jgi:hypothetical protein
MHNQNTHVVLRTSGVDGLHITQQVNIVDSTLTNSALDREHWAFSWGKLSRIIGIGMIPSWYCVLA